MAEPADPVGSGALTDAEILRSVETTVLEVLLPALRADAEWATATAVQLVGLVRYAATRSPDRTPERVDELAALLRTLGDNEIVAASWDGDPSADAIMAAVSAVLAASVSRADPAAQQVREVLRPVVVRHLDEELAETAPLVDAFRGNLDG